MRRLIIAGNWKMNTNLSEAIVLATMIRNNVEDLQRAEVVICPPTVFLYPLSDIISKSSKHLSLGAQNMFYEEEGAFTGETSPQMIKGMCRYVILGHSERRDHFKESSDLINDKIISALNHNLIPIVCVGEHKKNRESYKDAAAELKETLHGIPKTSFEKIVVSYEPVWAIGTGKPATPEYAAKAITLMREIVGLKTPILYGGSVSSENISSFTGRAEIDGALVGGASLKAKEFIKFVN